MRLPISCALAAVALVPQAVPAQPPNAAAAKPDRGAWVTTVEIRRIDEPAANPSAARFVGLSFPWQQAWQSWITAEDVPAEYRRRPLRAQSIVAVDVDAAGRLAGCRPVRAGPEPRLDALACELLAKRAKFERRYAGPGQPLPYLFTASVAWRNLPAAQVGPPPPPMFAVPSSASAGPPPPAPDGSIPSYAGWPRLAWTNPLIWENELLVGPAPGIQAAWPGGETGTVSLELGLSAEKGVTSCKIGVSSGLAALDEAACRAARTVPVRYERPCEFCRDRTLPLQVVWKKKGSFVRLPLPPDSPAYVGGRRPVAGTIVAADFAKLPNRSVSRRDIAALVTVGPDGRPTKCIVAQYSTGNRALDSRLCELVMERMRFSVRTDVFGQPAADLYWARVDLGDLR